MKMFLSILTLLVALKSLSQTIEDKKGYIGITLGPAFPLADIKDKGDGGTGLNINLVNFGYTFGKNIGISALWSGGAHLSKSLQEDAISSYGTLLIGPLYRIPITEKSHIHVKAMIGSVYSAFEYKFEVSRAEIQSLSIGYSFGAVYTYSFSKNWCLMLNTDYLSAKSSLFVDNGKIAAINVNAGVGFRLK
ncbi:MAG: hypothetical protein KF846_00460 [Cyclobacteriaceae bacterium]|nr:hypothetical protein [Cyclobacteriaceae bacterium]